MNSGFDSSKSSQGNIHYNYDSSSVGLGADNKTYAEKANKNRVEVHSSSSIVKSGSDFNKSSEGTTDFYNNRNKLK